MGICTLLVWRQSRLSWKFGLWTITQLTKIICELRKFEIILLIIQMDYPISDTFFMIFLKKKIQVIVNENKIPNQNISRHVQGNRCWHRTRISQKVNISNWSTTFYFFKFHYREKKVKIFLGKKKKKHKENTWYVQF